MALFFVSIKVIRKKYPPVLLHYIAFVSMKIGCGSA